MSGRILVVDDEVISRIVLRARLDAAFYEVLLAADGTAALRIARRRRPDVIVLDAHMPGMDGYEICRRLKAEPATRDIAVMMITAGQDAMASVRALAAGADDFIAKPVEEAVLLSRLRRLLREQALLAELRQNARACHGPGLAEPPELGPVAPGRVRIVCSDRAEAAALAERLAALMPHDVASALPGELFAAGEGQAQAEVILLCAGDARARQPLPALLADLLSRPGTRDAAVIVLLPEGASDGGADLVDLGASDCIPACVPLAEIAARVQALLRRRRHLAALRAQVEAGLRLAVTDPLTGLSNRRFAAARLERLAERCTRRGETLAVMLLDIDRFKAVNDSHGHLAGDAVLAGVAERLRRAAQDADLIARYGGEEFLVAATGLSADAARAMAEAVRCAVARTPFPLPGREKGLNVTLCAGVVVCGPGEALPLETLLTAADRALYASKSGGRNSVHLVLPAA